MHGHVAVGLERHLRAYLRGAHVVNSNSVGEQLTELAKASFVLLRKLQEQLPRFAHEP
ncbi:hypothetical protein D3C85_1755950 [compost metagenome]